MSNWRHEASKALLEQAAVYERQRDEAIEAIESLKREARLILNPHVKPTRSLNPTIFGDNYEIGRRAYEYLLDRPGSTYSHDDLMRQLKYSGKALASVILRPYINNGQVVTTGKGRGVQYGVRRPILKS